MVGDRRRELGMDQKKASIAGKIGDSTWSSVERGESALTERTILGVVRALGWDYYSIIDFLDYRSDSIECVDNWDVEEDEIEGEPEVTPERPSLKERKVIALEEIAKQLRIANVGNGFL
jgi:transcriptional regulator with XRE-family HTH domain